MDWIGGMFSGLGSVVGGLFNSSSAQAINTQNLQQQMMLANNAVSMRVADAKRAGINPLAALGVSSPGFVGSTPTDPGSGLMAGSKAFGEAMQDVFHPHQERMMQLQEQRAELENANVRALGNNTAIQIARDSFMLDQLYRWGASHPGDWIGPEGPTLAGSGAGALDRLNRALGGVSGSVRDVFSRVPQEMWNTP